MNTPPSLALALSLAAAPLGCSPGTPTSSDKAPAAAKTPTSAKPSVNKATPTSGPTSGPTSQPTSGPTSGPTSQPTSMAAAPAGNGQAAPELPADHPPMPAGDVKGTLKLDGRLKGDVKAGKVLFLVARRDTGGKGKGMLLAAKKIPVTGAAMFPLAYTLSQADVMMQGTQLNGVVTVSARIDGDGDALSKTPGDLTGVTKAGVPVGSSGVDITLDTKL